MRALDDLAAGKLEFTEQDDAQATYAEKVSAEERHLLPSRPAAELERIVRALTPHVGAYLELEGGERLGVREARAVQDGPVGGCDRGARRPAGGRLRRTAGCASRSCSRLEESR